MMKTIRWLSLMALVIGLAGCTSTITNISVTRQPRNQTGLYPVEAMWETAQQTVRPESIEAHVVIGFESYKMRPTLGLLNRWETVVPVPPDKSAISYHIRFDYIYDRFGKPAKGSRLSQGYILEIIDK